MSFDWGYSGVCLGVRHNLCGGWQCICDCHDADMLLGARTEHDDCDAGGWRTVGGCVYCSCGTRLYQGPMPGTMAERLDVLDRLSAWTVQATINRNEMIRAKRKHKGLPASLPGDPEDAA